jgi:hypothetical protein
MWTKWLILLAGGALAGSVGVRPKGIDGPRPEPVAPTGKGFEHGGLTTVLSKVARPDGTVDYAALQSDRAALDRYLGQLRAASPKNAPHRFKTREDRLAYYLNAYNAFMLAAVRDHCPLTNVNDVSSMGGLFWRVGFVLGDETVSLSQLESELIAEVKGSDAAVRFAVVKGAKGSAALPQAAYEGATLKAQLDALVQRVVRDPKLVQPAGDAIKLSQIFEWYTIDFQGDPLKWLKGKAPDIVGGAKSVEYVPFDWSLNGTCGG